MARLWTPLLRTMSLCMLVQVETASFAYDAVVIVGACGMQPRTLRGAWVERCWYL